MIKTRHTYELTDDELIKIRGIIEYEDKTHYHHLVKVCINPTNSTTIFIFEGKY